MADFWTGLGVMALLSAACLVLPARLPPKRWLLYALAGATVAAIVLFVTFLLDNVRMAWLLPFACLPVVGNWLPPLACLLAGLAWRLIPGAWWRRCITLVPLVALCLWKSWGWYFEPLPEVESRWEGGVCMQTSGSSCSAASAATLLSHYGIRTSEAEMARLCMTRSWGTSMWGVYRGLTLKTRGTGYRVVVDRLDVDGLRRAREPLLLVAGISRREIPADPRYTRDWGWTPGVFHAVCFLEPAEDDLILIADPSTGLDHWSRENLAVLWDGAVLRIRERR